MVVGHPIFTKSYLSHVSRTVETARKDNARLKQPHDFIVVVVAWYARGFFLHFRR